MLVRDSVPTGGGTGLSSSRSGGTPFSRNRSRSPRSSRNRTGSPRFSRTRGGVTASAGTGFRTGLRRHQLTLVTGVGVGPVGRGTIRIHLIGFAKLLLRRDAHALCFLLLFLGVPAQPLRLDFGLFGISLGTCRLGLTVAGTEFIGLGFLAHFRGPVPVCVRLPLAVEEQHRGNDRRNYDDADNDPHELS
jgi:hypothetical protein